MKKSGAREMRDDPLSDNPYSRLMALKKMGVVKNYNDIQFKTVMVVGIGGVGSVVCEQLCRLGIGKLILFDYDVVEMCNMNRMFYLPTHSERKMFKVDAAKEMLESINSDVEIEIHNCNVNSSCRLFVNRILFGKCAYDGDRLESGSSQHTTVDDSPDSVDIILCCVDNYATRITISTFCNKLNATWFNTGVSETSMSGQVQLCVPGYNACYQCAPPNLLAKETESNAGSDARTDVIRTDVEQKIERIREMEKSIKREGVCTASLPTTMCIVSSLLVQNVLKYLLGFGSICKNITYSVFDDFFTGYSIMCNPDCTDDHCRLRQREWREKNKVFDDGAGRWSEQTGNSSGHVVHEDEFSISIEEEGYDNSRSAQVARKPPDAVSPTDGASSSTETDDLEELRQQFHNL